MPLSALTILRLQWVSRPWLCHSLPGFISLQTSGRQLSLQHEVSDESSKIFEHQFVQPFHVGMRKMSSKLFVCFSFFYFYFLFYLFIIILLLFYFTIAYWFCHMVSSKLLYEGLETRSLAKSSLFFLKSQIVGDPLQK